MNYRSEIEFAFLLTFVTGILSVNRSLEDDENYRKFFLPHFNFFWPDSRVPYIIAPAFEQKQKDAIYRGIRTIEAASCVWFEQRSPNEPIDAMHLYFTTAPGCGVSTSLEAGKRQVKLKIPECINQYYILHALMMALGFNNMQSNFDRDKYIKINWNNIKKSQKNKFLIRNETDHGNRVGFDFDSITLARRNDGGKKGADVMESILAGPPMKNETQQYLSNNDIYHLNLAYNCSMKGIRYLAPILTMVNKR